MMKTEGIYYFNTHYILVEITLNCSPEDIDWFGFGVPEPGTDEFTRAAPYMEQYLTADGCDKICDAWEEPEDEDLDSTRVAFFIECGHGDVLETPYGHIDISDPDPLPIRLYDIIEFEEP